MTALVTAVRTFRLERIAQVAAAVLLIVAPAEDAAAASSVSSGWWTSEATPAPPDVPPDGLLVRSTVRPTAYAAVSFELADDERADSLTLIVVEGSASNPATTLRLCPLTEPIEVAQGGSAADAPDYDCTHAVDAAPDQGSYDFDVSTLPTTQTLAVAVLPTGPVDRAVLEAPDVDSLSTVNARASNGPTTTTVPTSPTSVPTRGGAVTAPSPVSPPSSPETVRGADVDDPPVDDPPVDEPEVAPPTTTTSQEIAQPTEVVDPLTGSTTSRIAQAALVAALLAAVALWITSGTLAHNRARRHRHRVSAPV